MGYYTYYSLEVHGIKTKDEHISLREIMNNYYGFAHDENEFYESTAFFPAAEEMKWYEHEYEMINISKQFPDMTFCLEGVGEDREDMWRKYFHNGNVEYCLAHIEYPTPRKIQWDD